MQRRRFIEVAAGSSAAWSVGSFFTERLRVPAMRAVHDNFPRQPLDVVRAVVGAAHTDLEKVRELVTAQPSLAKCAWDLGYGDWESPLDAASHTGRRAIAEFLLAQGARPTIFSAAMLGQLDVVKAFVAASPGIERTHGPHGISLMRHARAGGALAEPVVRYLTALGDADTPVPTSPVDAATRAACVGLYAFGPTPGERLEVTEARDALRLARSGGSPQNLNCRVGTHFFPSGAPAVDIEFSGAGGAMSTLIIVDGGLRLVAARVP